MTGRSRISEGKEFKIGYNLFCTVTLIFLSSCQHFCFGQTIPLGEWESHFSYLSARHVVEAGNLIFCSTYNGLFRIDPKTRETKILSKAEGLNEVGISSFTYNESEKTLVFAYRSGNLDLVSLDSDGNPVNITHWPLFQGAVNLPASKHVSQLVVKDGFTYMATNFGIVVIDTQRMQIRESYRYIGENGAELPITSIAFTNDSIFAITNKTIMGSSMASHVNRQYFANWKSIQSPYPVAAIAAISGNLYAGCTSQGVFKRNDGYWQNVLPSESKYYTMQISGDSLLATLDDKIVALSHNGFTQTHTSTLFTTPKESIYSGSGNLWIADNKNGLISNLDGDFKSYSIVSTDTTIFPRTDSSVVDFNGLTWARLPAGLSGGISVKSPQNNQQRFLSTSVGNGGLPSSNITSLSIDQDGYIWFSSDRGVGYFMPDGVLSGGRMDAVHPIYGQRRLFANERCNAIAVEPGNRKWIATNTGLYQFTSDGTELMAHFTSEYNPLPSDQVIALKHEPESGMLFIDTPNGLVSYRTNSTSSSDNFSSVVIFPNPVRPGYTGLVGIKGLIDKSIVKITTLSGKLVYETRAEGGTASWNLNDYHGKRVQGGIYMVFVNSPGEDSKFAGKLAIIE